MFIINQVLKADKIPAGKGEELFKQHIAWFTKHFEQGDFLLVGPYTDKEMAGIMITGAETREANLALREIALNGTPHSRLLAAKGINDPEIASDPEVVEAIERMEEADRRYENAMIASDSGLYTTG